MAASARSRWLDEGLAVLAVDGHTGVRIDRLAARLGLSKGSFHHHFAGVDAYRAALLEHWELRATGALASAATVRDDESPRAVLLRLTERAADPRAPLAEPALDVAVRAWAAHDDRAREAVGRVDSARIAALTAVWGRITPSTDEAAASALLPYLVYLGSTVVQPRPTGEELARVYGILLRLVPGDD